MDRYFHRLLDIYLEKYINKHPDQLKTICEMDTAPKRFLVISSTALGDTILSTPAIKSLRKSFPEANITLFLHENIAPLFRGYPYVDDFILYHGGYKKFFGTLRAMREKRPEAVLIFHGNGPQDIAFSVLSGANFILKHPTQSPHKKYLSTVFEQKKQHTIEDRLDIVRVIGGQALETTMEIPSPDNAENEKKVDKFLPPGSDITDLVGFQIGAANVYKMWPIDNFIRLARKILQASPSSKIVITGIPRERSLGERIVKACGSGQIINSCGLFTISELPYLIKRLRLLITGDTGTMHLAIALRTPALCLFSATDHTITGPYQDPQLHTVIQKSGGHIGALPKKKRDDRVMKLISVEEVYGRYEDFMHNRSI